MKKLTLLIVVLGTSVVLAEERQKVFLIDGSSIVGETVSATDSTVSIETNIGMTIIKKSKILRIEKITQEQGAALIKPSELIERETKSIVFARQKDVGTGLVLSLLVPGGGHFYANAPGEGAGFLAGSIIATWAATSAVISGDKALAVSGVLASLVLRIGDLVTVPNSIEHYNEIQLSGQLPAAITARRLKGSFSISSEPAGAKVFLKGKLQGNTPLQVTDFPAGSYEVMLVMEPYRVWKDTVKIKDWGTKRVHALLAKKSGALAVHSDPKGAEVHIDEKAEGKTPLKIEEMKTGQHELELTSDGYLDYEDTFLIKDRETTKVTACLIEKEDHKKRRLANERYRRALMGKKIGEYTTLSLGIGCGIAAVISHLRAEDAYARYEDAIAEGSIEEHYEDYERSLLKSRIWGGTSGALALISTYFFLRDVEKPKLNLVNSSQSLKFNVLPQLFESGIWICVQQSF
jgi:hypothetical protein